jgi:hypothetical protein
MIVPTSPVKFIDIGFISSGQEVIAILSVGVGKGTKLETYPVRVPPEMGGAVKVIFWVWVDVFPLPSL